MPPACPEPGAAPTPGKSPCREPESRVREAALGPVDTPPSTAETEPNAPVPASRTSGLSPEARAAVEEGIPAETRGYAGDWHRFTTWRTSTGRKALPARADTATEYVTRILQPCWVSTRQIGATPPKRSRCSSMNDPSADVAGRDRPRT